MGCDSIATTISGMGKEPTTLGPEDLKGHRFSAFWLRQVVRLWPRLCCGCSIFERKYQEEMFPGQVLASIFVSLVRFFDAFFVFLWYVITRARPHGGGRATRS